jgi:hypothetical protein
MVILELGRAGAVAVTSARADAAADAAALAAAEVLARSGTPSDARAAGDAAAAGNGAVLERCDCSDDHAEVLVTMGDVRGRARAEVDRCAPFGACRARA